MFHGGATVEAFEKLADHTIVVADVAIPVDVFGRASDTLIRGNFNEDTARDIIQLKTASAGDITTRLQDLLKDDGDRRALLRVLQATATA